MKDYLIHCIIELLDEASEQDTRVIYAFVKRWMHR